MNSHIPRILVVAPASVVSVVINLAIPLNALERLGAITVSYTMTNLCRTRDVAAADAVVFCRPSEVRDLRLMAMAKRLGKRVIANYDDHLLDVPAHLPFAATFNQPVTRAVIQAFHRHADQVQIYTAAHAALASAYQARVAQMRQIFDRRLIEGLSPAPTSADGRIRVAFPTSRSKHDYLSAIFRDAFGLLDPSLTNRMSVHVWGAVPEPLNGIPGVTIEPYRPDYADFLQSFYRAGFDIGLAPIADDAHHRCKTELKFREYGGCGVAGIYSDVPPYRGAVTQEASGLLVPNRPDAWAAAIARLAGDADLRARLARQARSDGATLYSLDAGLEEWRLCLGAVLATPVAPMPAIHIPPRSLPKRARKVLSIVRSRLRAANRAWLTSLEKY